LRGRRDERNCKGCAEPYHTDDLQHFFSLSHKDPDLSPRMKDYSHAPVLLRFEGLVEIGALSEIIAAVGDEESGVDVLLLNELGPTSRRRNLRLTTIFQPRRPLEPETSAWRDRHRL
jgi:hypothetical protein